MNNKTPFRKWLPPSKAKKIPEGSIVLIKNNYGHMARYDIKEWFRPDYVDHEFGYGRKDKGFRQSFMLVAGKGK